MAKRKPQSRVRASGRSPKGPGRAPGQGTKAPARAPDRTAARSASGTYWLYGWHAALAALANPERRVLRARATPEALERLSAEAGPSLAKRALPLESARRTDLDELLPAGAVHQGLALEVRPLAASGLAALLDGLDLSETAAGRPCLVALDQVSDPQNVGAVLRSAAAFGARAVLAPRHGQAPETGALAKAASGALEVVPYLDAGNLARALGLLKDRGFWVVGLAGEARQALAAADPGGPLVLVLGGEGRGLRRLTREACDLVVRLPTQPPPGPVQVGQLNVSNAAAVALYEVLGRGN